MVAHRPAHRSHGCSVDHGRRRPGARTQTMATDNSVYHVLTSSRQPARRTCELVGLSATAEIEPDLSEWDYGDYEGQRSEDICKRRPGWNNFRDGCPGGESPAQIGERVDRLIARLRMLEGNIALFSHGEFGRVMAARWIGAPVLEGQSFALCTPSLSILGYEPPHPDDAGHRAVERRAAIPTEQPIEDYWRIAVSDPADPTSDQVGQKRTCSRLIIPALPRA